MGAGGGGVTVTLLAPKGGEASGRAQGVAVDVEDRSGSCRRRAAAPDLLRGAGPVGERAQRRVGNAAHGACTRATDGRGCLMRVRHHHDGGTVSASVHSACGRYRYALTRAWGDGPRLLAVLLNPSTADATRDDPTLARCMARARQAGCGALRVVNLFALCATDPRALARAADPVGPGADASLREGLGWADLVLCGWGNHGTLAGRSASVRALLRAAGRPLLHLGLTRRGEPRHPLYLAAARRMEPWP